MGGNQALSSFPSVSSSVQNSDLNLSVRETQASLATNTNNKKAANLNRRNESVKTNGILMSEENTIFYHLDMFCNRIKCVSDQMVSLAQFQSLYRTSSSLSRPKREDLNSVRINRKDQQDSPYDNDDDDNETEVVAELDAINNEPNASANANLDVDTNKALGILMEESEYENRNGEYLIQSESKNQKLEGDEILGLQKIKETNEDQNKNVSSDSDFDENEDLDREQNDDVDINVGESKNRLQNNSVEGSVGLNTEKLFKLEKNIEHDSKKILQKAQTLSREDLKLMSNLLFSKFRYVYLTCCE